MSKQVDERVVSMQFDNKYFEKNVQTTLSTLEKLKQKTNFKDSAKSFEALDKAAKKVDMSSLTKSVETVRTKFSALEVMGVTALANLTNSAVNAGKRIAAALTIQPISTGFNEYELKMDSVKTIMASTGETIEKVNGYLNELNEYSDQTIYSFADMTQNIGKFTNAGVKLEDAVMAIKGISNEAAVSGANANEASRAMYNFAQALSAGHVKLIDWKSIELANMATKEFKEQLIQSAVAAGTLTKAGDGMYKTLGGKTLNATKDFNDSLKDEWMTTEVLIGTLKEYADNTTEIGNKAFAAAQDVTKFTQMMDVLKETAQSGWARTWEIIFGDLEQAKAVFTPLTNFFSKIIGGMSDFRNNLLEGALSSPLGKFAEKIATVTSVTSKAAEKMQNYGDIVNKIINGDFGNGQARFDKLAEAGYDWAHAQNLVNEKLGNTYRYATNLDKAQGKLKETTIELTDAKLKEIGLTNDEIKAYRELEEQSKKTGKPINELIKDMDQLDGRTMLIRSFKNAGQGLVKSLTAIKDAWVDIFPPMTSQQLYNIIEAVYKFSQNLAMTDKTAGKLERTFKGVFAIFDIILTVIGGPIKLAFKIFTQLLGAADIDILTFTASVGDAIVGFRDFIDSTLDFTKAFEKILPSLKTAANGIRDWISGLKEVDNVPKYIISGLINGLKAGIQIVGDTIWELGTTIVEKIKAVLGIHSPSTVFFAIGGFIIAGLVAGLASGKSQVFDTISSIGSNMVELLKGIVGKVVEFLQEVDVGDLLSLGSLVGVFMIIKKMSDAFELLSKPIEGISAVLEGLGDTLSGLGDKLKASALKNKSEAIRNMAVSIAILVGSLYVLTKLDWKQALVGVGILALLGVVVVALSAAASWVNKNGGSFGKLAISLVGISLALLIMASALKKLEFLDSENLEPVITGFAAMIIGLTTLLVLFGKFVKGKAAQNIDKAGITIMKISAAMLLLTYVMKQIGSLEPGYLDKGITFMILFGSFVVGMIAATKLAGKKIDSAGATIFKISAAMLLFVGVIKLISGIDPSELGKGITAISFFTTMIILLIAATRLAGNNINKIGSTIMGIAGAMMLMAFTVRILGGMDGAGIAKGLVAVTTFGLITIGLLAIVKTMGNDTPKVAGTILALSTAMGIMALATIALSLISLEGLTKGVTAISILGLVMAGMIKATRGASDCKGNLVVMTVAIGVMAAAVAALSFIKPEKLAGATAAMGILMGLFALILKVGGKVQSSMGPLIVMTAAIGMIAGAIYLIAQIPAEKALNSSLALSAVMLALSGVLKLVSTVGGSANNAVKGVVGLIAMCGLLVGLAFAINAMPNVEGQVNNIIVLTATMAAMSLLLLALTGIGLLMSVSGGVGPILGIVGLIAMVTPLKIFTKEIQKLPDLSGKIETVQMLTTFMGHMTDMLFKLSLVGPLALIAVPAITAMIGVFTAFGGLATGVGALVSKFPQLEEFLDKGIPIFEKLANGLGSVMGNFVSGFATGVMSGLPEIGSMLSQFMVNTMPFIVGIKMVDEKAAAGVSTMVGAILKLTAASFLQGIVSLMDEAPTFGQLGKMLSEFMRGAMDFILLSPLIKPEAAEGVKHLASAILTLTAADLLSGITSFISGEASFASFGEELSSMGEGLAGFAESLSELDEDQLKGVEHGAKAIKLIAEAADAIPKEGGLAGTLFGEKGLSSFGKDMVSVGKSLVSFSSALEDGDFTEDSYKAIKNASKSIKAVADVAKELPSEGGAFESLFGKKSLAEFGKKLPDLGKNLADFAKKAGDVKKEKVDRAVNVLNAVVGLSKLKLGTFNDNIVELGENLDIFGADFKAFTTTVGGISKDKITSVVEKVKDLVSVATAIKSDAISAIDSMGSALKELGENGIKKFTDSFSSKDAASDIKEGVKALVTTAQSAVKTEDNYNKFKTAGEYLVDGLVKGIKDNTYKVEDQIEKMAKAAITKAHEEFDEHSPSRVFEDIGLYTVLGLVKGVAENTVDAVGSMKNMAKAMIGGFEDEMEINSPSLKMNEEGHYIVQGVAEGIKKDTTAEEAARLKAQNIAEAFQKEFDKISRSSSIAEKQLEYWSLTDGIKATDAEKESKQLEYLNGELERKTREQSLAYDKWQEMKRYYEKGQVEADAEREAYEAWWESRNALLTTQMQIDNLNQNGELDRRIAELQKGIDVRATNRELWEKTTAEKLSEDKKNAKYLEDYNRDLIAQTEQLSILNKKHSDAVNTYHGSSQEVYDAWQAVRDQEALIADTKKAIADIMSSSIDSEIESLNEVMNRRSKETELWLEGAGRYATGAVLDARTEKDLKANLSDLNQQLATEETRYIKLLRDGYSEEHELVKESYDRIMDYKISIKKTQNEINDLAQNAIERERESLELAADTADLQYSIWEQTTGRKATTAEKNVAKIATLTKQLSSQSGMLNLARKEYADACKKYGKYSNEATAAYNDYLNEQLELANLQNEIIDINEKTVTRQKLAKSEYQDYVEKYSKFYSMNGMTQEQLEKDAKLVSGYDPNNTVSNMVTKTQRSLDKLKDSEEYNKLLSSFTSMGTSYVSAVNDGVGAEMDTMMLSITNMMDECVRLMSERIPSWQECGKHLVEGFVEGIKSNIQKAVRAAVELAVATEQAVRAELDEHSPSRKFADIGAYAVLGFVEGLSKYSTISAETAATVGKQAVDMLRESIANISDSVDGDLDVRPTITPVVDLSEVKEGTATLNSMFSRMRAVEINSRINKANESVGGIQNGTNTSKGGNTYIFTQNNHSPKALSRIELYRQTRNQLAAMKEVTT